MGLEFGVGSTWTLVGQQQLMTQGGEGMPRPLVAGQSMGEPFFEMRKVQLALSCVRSDDLLETVNDPSALLPLSRQQSLRLMPKSLEQTYQQMGAAAVPPQRASVLECWPSSRH